jgi:hypothetical protein
VIFRFVDEKHVVAGLGEAAAGVVSALDSVTMPDVVIAPPMVEVGIAPPGHAEHQVAFQPAASLSNGAFTATLPHPGEPARAWARACLLGTCGPASILIPA